MRYLHVILPLLAVIGLLAPICESFKSTSSSSSSSLSRNALIKGRRTRPPANRRLSLAPINAGDSELTSTCKLCKQQYLKSQNSPTSCRHHPGIYTGRLARIEDADPSGAKDYFWNCCGADNVGDEGCVVGYHKSYDE